MQDVDTTKLHTHTAHNKTKITTPNQQGTKAGKYTKTNPLKHEEKAIDYCKLATIHPHRK